MKLTLSVALFVIQGFTLNMCLQASFGPMTVTVCEGDQETISCPPGKVLRISSALYGRKDATTCPHQSIQTTNCEAECGETKMKVKCWCNGLTSCTLQANNGQFGDPCVGTYKYLQVEYRCVTPPPRKLKAVVCEGNTQTIGCPVGYVLKILNAWYGRKQSCRCPHSQISDTNCKIGGLEQVRNWCDGETSCDLQSNNGVFTDPCVGTYKYLQVRYRCKPGPMTVTVCEGDQETISCPPGKVLRISSALYGRKDATTCPHQSIQTTNCEAGCGETKRKVKCGCNGLTSCALQANNGQFGDPCVGTYKYLQVEYRCVTPPPRKLRAVVCEGNTQTIGCPVGYVIKILKAWYGRKQSCRCPHSQISDTNCKIGGLEQVRNWCDGETSCDLQSNNGVFTDPCVGTYKYLQVRYRCKPGQEPSPEPDPTPVQEPPF